LEMRKPQKDITIEGLEEAAYLEIKEEADKRGKDVGELINEAMRLWLNQNVIEVNRSILFSTSQRVHGNGIFILKTQKFETFWINLVSHQ